MNDGKVEYEMYKDHFGHDLENFGHQKIPRQTVELIDRKHTYNFF